MARVAPADKQVRMAIPLQDAAHDGGPRAELRPPLPANRLSVVLGDEVFPPTACPVKPDPIACELMILLPFLKDWIFAIYENVRLGR